MIRDFYTLLVLSILFVNPLFCQTEIDVTDQTLKIGAFAEEELMFGFAEGDKLIFNFQEKENNELKEVEIIEYPNNSKFSDFKTSKIQNKVININKTAVYVFRFKNSGLKARICKITLQRIPKSDITKNFNTTVSWVNKQDTTWNSYTKEVVVGYDTTYEQKTKKELVKTEQKEELLLDKSERVNSRSNENGNKSYVLFTLPINETTTYKSKEVISLAYWVGVGEAGNNAWQQNSKNISSLTKRISSVYLTPLGALAVGAVTELMIPNVGEDVKYYLVDQQDRDLFYANQTFNMYDKGKGVAGYRKFTNRYLLRGTHFIVMENDNYMQGINVNVKVIAIVETNYYEDKSFTEQIIRKKTEKQIFKDPIISTNKIPVTGN